MAETQSAPPTTTTNIPPQTTPETQPASAAAVQSGKTADYRVARRAERMGTPLAAVPVAIDPAAAPTEQPPSAITPEPKPEPRKARDETYISERIREGVDRGTAELRAEIERLKQHVQARPPAEEREPQKPYDGIDPSDPKPFADDFENHDEYLDARDVWNERRIHRKQVYADTEGRARRHHDDLTTAERARVQTFADQLQKASAADPEFAAKLTPEVRALKPFSALGPKEASGPANVVGDQVFDSPIAAQVLAHFSAHPEALARLIAMPAEIQAMPSAVRVARHIHWIVKEFGKLEATLSTPEPKAEPKPAPAPSKTLTSAPSPAQTLGSRPAAAVDPKAAAVKSGDTQAYRNIRRQERAAQMGRR